MGNGKRFGDPHAFFACIGVDRTCGQNARPGEITCEEHKDLTRVDVKLPQRVLLRYHLTDSSKFGGTFLDELIKEGVRVVERTAVRQVEITMKNMFSTGVRVFGTESDLGPNVVATPAIEELDKAGYRLNDVHIVNLDEINREANAEKIGARTLVLPFEYDPAKNSSTPTDTTLLLIEQPFLSSRVWTNLIDADGSQIHCVELIGIQFEVQAKYQLHFANSIWAFS